MVRTGSAVIQLHCEVLAGILLFCDSDKGFVGGIFNKGVIIVDRPCKLCISFEGSFGKSIDLIVPDLSINGSRVRVVGSFTE